MAAIRIQLAGRKEASVIALQGDRITIGRSPTNTLQVCDRTMSLQHAELIDEGEGHYRLHDLGSTNGVFVNGQQVTDYHLNETCKLAFGTLECEFFADIPPGLNVPVEPLPSPVEAEAAHTENSELKGLLTRLQSEIESLQNTAASHAEARAFAIAREQHESVLDECKSLKAELAQAQADMTTLRTARDDLLRACDERLAALDSVRAENAQLKTRLEALAKDSEALDTLRSEHSALKNAHDLLETETLQLKAERNTSRRENSKLQTTIEVQARELAALQESQASLTRKMATLISPEEHQKLVAEHASVKGAHERLQEEIAQIRQDLASTAVDREALQKTVNALREANTKLEEHTKELTELAAEQATSAKEVQEHFQKEITRLEKDHQAALDFSRAENAQLKTRLEALAKDSEALDTLRSEHSALKNAHDLLETETLQLKAERNTSRRENSKLQTTIEVQARELAALQESQASLTRKMATLISPEEHQKLVAEHASVKGAHERLQEEIAQIRQDLASTAADREALQKTVNAQRAELAAMPKPAELDSLRAANAELKERAEKLTKVAAEQSASAKETQERLQKEITQLRQDLSGSTADRDALQKTIDTLRAELAAMPKPAELDSLRAANAELKEHAEKLSKLAAEQAASAKEAQAHLQEELTQLRQNLAGLTADRDALQKTIDAQRYELERMPKPAELDSLRAANAELEERAEKLTKIAAEHASAKELQEGLMEEITYLKKTLADVAADRDTLQKTIDAQRAELETMPKLGELDSLRAANAKLEECVKELTAEIASLRKTQSTSYVPKEEHEKLVAEYAAMKEAQQRREAELEQVNRRLAESLTQHANVTQTLKAREDELNTLRNRPEPVAPVPDTSPDFKETRAPARDDRHPISTLPPAEGMGLEEALGELGFVIRPVKQQTTP